MEDMRGVEIKVILERTIKSMWEKPPLGDWALKIDGTCLNCRGGWGAVIVVVVANGRSSYSVITHIELQAIENSLILAQKHGCVCMYK